MIGRKEAREEFRAHADWTVASSMRENSNSNWRIFCEKFNDPKREVSRPMHDNRTFKRIAFERRHLSVSL